jgi:hypothetical protein
MDGGQFACVDDVPAPDTNLIIVNDYCDPLTISSMDVSNGGDGCPGSALVITRTYTIADGAGSSGTCVQTITVVDDVLPTITCPADITVNCDDGVDPILTGSPVVNDNCTAEGDLIVGFVDSGNPGICATDPPVVRTWTVTDECGNSATCQQTITVQDIVPPVVDMGSCPSDVTVECGSAIMFAGPPTYTDNCTATGLIVLSSRDDSTGFDGSCINQVVGTVTRTFFAEDLCGNIDSSCVATATVEDTTPPVLLSCPDDTTVQCSAPADTLGFPTYMDVCSEVTVTFQDDTVGFMPPILGMIIRTFYGTDACGNVDSSCVQTITIQDSVAPTCVTIDITINLDAAGDATIANDALDDGSSDDCGVESITLSQTQFNCTDVGDVVVTQTVTDFNGNSSSCTGTVTVVDVTAPECLTQDITVQLDVNGEATIADDAVDNGSNDACGIQSISVSPNQFLCADVGVVVVTQTVTDVNGNSSTCTANVTIEDNIAPECLAQDITVSLDDAGMLTLLDDAINNTSTDACGIGSITISPNMFDCSDVGVVVVFQTVTDINGNSSSCSANVTIEDNTGPECLTQDITVYLDGAGNATIGDGDVDNGSNDACGIESFDVSPNAFTCADIGDNVVTQTVSDVNGNVSTCTATVSVQDTIAPIAQHRILPCNLMWMVMHLLMMMHWMQAVLTIVLLIQLSFHKRTLPVRMSAILLSRRQ